QRRRHAGGDHERDGAAAAADGLDRAARGAAGDHGARGGGDRGRQAAQNRARRGPGLYRAGGAAGAGEIDGAASPSTRRGIMSGKSKWDHVGKWVERAGLKTTWKPYGMPEILDPFTSRFADIDPMPKWDIPAKVMISSTITGAFFSKRTNPN